MRWKTILIGICVVIMMAIYSGVLRGQAAADGFGTDHAAAGQPPAVQDAAELRAAPDTPLPDGEPTSSPAPTDTPGPGAEPTELLPPDAPITNTFTLTSTQPSELPTLTPQGLQAVPTEGTEPATGTPTPESTRATVTVTPTRRPPLVNVQPAQVARSLTTSIIFSALYIGLGLIAAYLTRRIVFRLMAQVHPAVQTFAAKVSFYLILAISGLGVLRAWNIESANLAAILASLGLAISLSFQDLFRNIIAGVFLLVERPFNVGDELTIGTVTGRVLFVDLRATTLITEDGRKVYVPNQRMISDIVVRDRTTDNQ